MFSGQFKKWLFEREKNAKKIKSIPISQVIESLMKNKESETGRKWRERKEDEIRDRKYNWVELQHTRERKRERDSEKDKWEREGKKEEEIKSEMSALVENNLNGLSSIVVLM